jgi:hypothetical protein
MAGAQTPGTEAANRAALQKVSVVRGETGVSIELTAKGTIAPRVETLSSPSRLVVNLPNTALATSVSHISVGSSGVTGVRIGTDSSETTRVVVDLQRPMKYELVPGIGGKLTLKLDSGAMVAQAPAAPVAAAEKTKTAAPVVTASLTAPTVAKPEASKPAAQDFVVVQPTFAPKKDAAQVDPPVRETRRQSVASAQRCHAGTGYVGSGSSRGCPGSDCDRARCELRSGAEIASDSGHQRPQVHRRTDLGEFEGR